MKLKFNVDSCLLKKESVEVMRKFHFATADTNSREIQVQYFVAAWLKEKKKRKESQQKLFE